MTEPDPLRLAWRDLIKQTIREVVTHPGLEPLASIQPAVARHAPGDEQSQIQALIIGELKRLHQGALARCGLRPSAFTAWRMARGY
ncbi:hypothetical protein [Herbaspirillum sp. YR522]|uniref:hypothetical protein n=1 Tax=Herbaspirillum sp. YR522 TaxID=1144342 RepID=UPI000590E473|nr:hypothetical protein [Herbaspirillum sp. YR522]